MPRSIRSIIFNNHIIIIFFFGSSIFSSCEDIFYDAVDTLDSGSSSYSDEDYTEDIIYFEGEKTQLTTIYEQDDTTQEYPYYYDQEGNVYDYEYAQIDSYEYYNFTKETIANIKLLEMTHLHSKDEGFVTAFIEPGTYNVYYILGYTFYDTDDMSVDSTKITIPSDVTLKIIQYHSTQNSVN